ncbi:hypothetical protein NKK48_30240 [Mesorhizobium sp. C386A]|uniref:hypothetical protein n=1 Tax=unclassified Mesorhizobium TaxID=325217 RepID=UPI0003CDEBF5|nr:hypothetical protein [Mesorhizobium sp. LNJC386A00]ESY35716.1 hypothetical protein X748_13955 [Mesorhizobium sp. LNJC386A00]
MKAPDGTAIDRTKEVILGECGINWNDDGSFDFDGSGTQPDWDSQETATLAGQTVFFDEAGREWLESQLIPDDAEELPADQIKPWYIDRALRRVEIVNTIDALMVRVTGKKIAVKDCQALTRAITLLLDRSEPT